MGKMWSILYCPPLGFSKINSVNVYRLLQFRFGVGAPSMPDLIDVGSS